MKIKNDFVTNSSSTNFFFIFKGPRCVKSAVSAVWNHRKSFNLHYYLDENGSWSCKCEDIIEDIERVVKSSLGKNEWNSAKVTNLDKKIKETEEEMKNQQEDHDSQMKDYPNDDLTIKWYKETMKHLKRKLEKFQEAKSKGFENILEMEWGDNHGHVSGGNTGCAMDYEGRRIRINSDDLIVFTEQNR